MKKQASSILKLFHLNQKFIVIWGMCLIIINTAPASFVFAQDAPPSAIMQDLLTFPGLEIVDSEGRQMVKGSLQATLQLVLKYNSQLKSAAMGESIAESGLIAAQERLVPTWNNSIGSSRESRENVNNNRVSVLKQDDSNSQDTENQNTENEQTANTENEQTIITENTAYSLRSNSYSNSFQSSLSKQSSLGINYSATFSQNISHGDTYLREKQGKALKQSSKTIDDIVTASLNFGVNVPILQDWGRVNDLPVERSQTQLEESRNSTAKTKLQVIETFAGLYWDLAGLWETRRVLQEAIKTSEKLVNDNRVRSELGVSKKTDLKQSEIQLLRNQQSLLEVDNRIRQVEDQVKVALNLKALPYGFIPGDTPQFREIAFDFNDLLGKAYGASLDLASLNNQLKNNTYDLIDAENQDAPNLDFSLSYTLNGTDKNLSDAIDQFGESNAHGYNVGLSWNIPLNDRRTDEQINQTKLARAQLEIQISSTKDQHYVDLKTIERNLLFAANDIRTKRVIRELSEELLDQEIEKQRLGQSTGLQVSQQQQELISAQSDEIQSLISFEKIYLSLLTLTGQVYSHYDLAQ